MMVSCPRCGFQQPQDKYCAQCGVDMESYKPQAAPWYQSFFKSTAVQLSLLVAVAGGGGFYIYNNGSTSNADIATTQARPTVQINASQNLPPPPPAAPEISPTEQPSVAAAQTADGLTITESASTVAAASVTPTEAKPDDLKKEARALAAKTSGPHLTVYYAEVVRPTLGRFMEASRGTGQFMTFADYSAGIIPAIGGRVQAAGVKILHKEERNLNNAKTLQWSYGIKDRGNPAVEIGLTTFFELADVEGNSIRGNLEIQRTWREAGASGGFEVQRKSFPAIFEIGGETGFFMTGVMPTQSNLENDDELTSIDVYKVLRSPQFRAGESEFVIFVEYDNH
ncbi:hypothetical protein [Bdellovibrio sp. HCB209]|uniref:hypothetical protein n=1 Tax=Bdellovibrio sp. HCB209 TaxID=3394354 RepID=UPI0039B39AB4